MREMELSPAAVLNERVFEIEENYLRNLWRARHSPDPEKAMAALGSRNRTARPLGDTNVAVIPLIGIVQQRASWWGASTELFSAALSEAIKDPSIGSVVVEVDSPGGLVYGVAEAAALILAARAVKPIIGVANSCAFSAAYFLLSQCTEVWVTPSGEIGSIGVFCLHEDWSRALDAAGVTITFVSAGEGKTDGNQAQPLSDVARADMQASVNRYYNQFVNAVAAGRRVPKGTVRDIWKAKVYGAEESVKLGLSDSLGTFTDAFNAAAAAGARAQRAVKAAHAEVELDTYTKLRARSRNAGVTLDDLMDSDPGLYGWLKTIERGGDPEEGAGPNAVFEKVRRLLNGEGGPGEL